jgi:hypothetical protein
MGRRGAARSLDVARGRGHAASAMSSRSLLGLAVFLAMHGGLGCARSAADQDAVEPDEGASAEPQPGDTGEGLDEEIEPEPDASEPEAPEPVADPDAEHITFDGPDAEPGPADQVVAPPQRPPMPSMMTDVLKTGPRR